MKNIYELSSDTLWNEINDDFEESGGAYRLFCKRGENIIPIQRLLGTDPSGILYIGSAISYLDRVIDLKKTIDPKYKSTPHIGGRRYNKNPRIAQRFPYVSLFIELIGDKNPESKEKGLLDAYFLKFGEVPPLNANG